MYQSVNPFDNSLIKEYPFDAFPDLKKSVTAQQQWAKLSVEERGKHLRKVADNLQKYKNEFAQLITLEMGKPLRESLYELDKTLSTFDYFIEFAPKHLESINIPSNASRSYVSFEPLGVLFSVMPWNFPFWQVFRFALPSLLAGNVTVLKHAPSVPGCAEAIAKLFSESDIPQNLLLNYYLSNEDAAKVIAADEIAGVSFTGSDATGSIIASLSGKHIKKSVIELGGNDAFIVMDDADLDVTIAGAIKSRSINSGQSCNAAKRFIVDEKIYDAFVEQLTKEVLNLKVGNPMDESTQVGPLARKDLAEKVIKQIELSVVQGAVKYQNKLEGLEAENFVAPCVLTNVKPGVCAFEEEIFGPVWSVIKSKNIQESIALANQSQYGLGASVWTNDVSKALPLIPLIQSGNVFINDIVKSDARLPFGGVKKSGFGRELSEFGLKEFVNIKTVYIH
jgi:succinate-semialdehyde dehydrogenase / glutarate-semialdehyde dehydrogenase